MTLTLGVEKREKGVGSKKLLKEGKIPAVFYGRKEASTPIAISSRDFEKLWKKAGESTVVTLAHGGKDLNALIYEVQRDPVMGNAIHADFYIVEADKEVEVNVPLEFIGVSPAVKELGGTLVKVLHEVAVSGLPKDLPQSFEVDISSLKTLEDQILSSELTLPSGITLRTEPHEVIAAISVAEEEVEEKTETFDASQIEVEKKGKADEGEGEETSDEKKE